MHRTLALLIGLLVPTFTFAASTTTLPKGIIDHAITQIDAAFTTAEGAVKNSPLDDSTAATVSNVLKTKHDTVKNSINNIR